ncbi:hypothetical protein IQ07DRAFT_232063 [Pyrenochaeta sp. DS3sAY3a]|nr:hypothetical protein IQ07DRAFT_232063 [Pyrenochaeta sp. DS3sAY3a]
MRDLPGTIPPSTSQLHPRRPPAHKSVSLRHSPPAASSSAKPKATRQPTTVGSPNPASDQANPPSSVSPKLNPNKYSSGESSDAGKWFETTNNNAEQANAPFTENEPPFILRNYSSSGTPPDGPNYTHPVIPYRLSMAQLDTDGSSTEDFRSVIDDLTIANKKLKQRLKKYEKLYDPQLEEDRLFEVRFHGLPDHKKKELEETLRKFASDLNDGGSAGYPPISSYAPAFEIHNTASSTSRFGESGYASQSASGQNSSGPLNQDQNSQKMSRSQYSRQQQNVQSYLHDIPVGLLPQTDAPMSEKSRKKLVVRRLEQIFAGRISASGNHQQPLQQEEVAQSAATADRAEREAIGKQTRPEGLREARIKPDNKDAVDVSIQNDVAQPLRPPAHVFEQDFEPTGSSPDQRPTRPLDLDLFRAQIPTENMQYIRHLGFTPPDMVSGDAPVDDHGWLYLNLLINMAQLHTLNVTPEFVKDALHEYSSHLEMSRDGRKIRWKGGLDVTKFSGGSSSEHLSGGSPAEIPSSGSPSKRIKTGHSGTSSEQKANLEQRERRLARAKREKERNQFTYKPLFFRKDESDGDEDYYGVDVDSSGNSLGRAQPTGNSSGFGSSGIQSSSVKPRREDGPMIFYKAKFCTDLSGDRSGASLATFASYNPITNEPLGTMAPKEATGMPRNIGLLEPRGPLDASPMSLESSNGSRTTSHAGDIGFSPSALNNDSGNESPEVMDFEASGLGGVQPEDNFSIEVRRSQIPTTMAEHSRLRKASLYPSKISSVLEEGARAEAQLSQASPPPRIIKEEILSASRKSLPNSTLPPASFFPFDSTSSGEFVSDDDSDLASDEDSESGDGPVTALQLLNVSPSGADEYDDDQKSGDNNSELSDNSDSSIDMLATARQLDPNTVQAFEREYDAALADRLSDEIPAGSSAATAGGGSGFNSPASQAAPPEGSSMLNAEGSTRMRQSTTSGSMSSRTKLKRARTSESLGATTKTAKSAKYTNLE